MIAIVLTVKYEKKKVMLKQENDKMKEKLLSCILKMLL